MLPSFQQLCTSDSQHSMISLWTQFQLTSIKACIAQRKANPKWGNQEGSAPLYGLAGVSHEEVLWGMSGGISRCNLICAKQQQCLVSVIT